MQEILIPMEGPAPPCPVCGNGLGDHSEGDLINCSENAKGKDILVLPYGDWASADLQRQNKK